MLRGKRLPFLASNDLPQEAQAIVRKYFLFSALMRGIFMLSSTFYFLFIVDLVGIPEAALLITVGFFLQGLIDYPTGAIGDKIGQKKVIFIAYMIHFIAFASLVFVESFVYLLFIYIGEAVGKSLESGAINSWFDNNYNNIALETDSNLEIYKSSNFTIEMLIGIFASSMFLIGGLLSYLIARKAIFLIQAIIMLFIGVFVLKSLNDVPTVKVKEQKKYKNLLTGTINHVLKNPRLLLFVMGTIIITTPITVWVELMLFVLYFGYTGSDVLAGLFRFIVWFFSSLFIGMAGFYTKKLTAKKSLYKMHLIHPFLFFMAFALIIAEFPILNTLQLVPLLLALIVFTLTATIHSSSNILTKSVFLELVPNEMRNSFYSLVPTLTMLFSSPIIYIFGLFLESFGLSVSIMLLGMIEIIGAVVIGLSFYVPTSWSVSTKIQSISLSDEAYSCCL